ncbi:Uncharacterized protein BCINRASA_02348 [Bacillus wiedmannii]|nr:Uncharacterized protein BCINRASA_02348 [Bacillus wiedmannii]
MMKELKEEHDIQKLSDKFKKTKSASASLNKIKNTARLKFCLHQDDNCSNKIIDAHSIQNNKILNHISDNGYVLMFDPDLDDDYEFKIPLRPKGRKVATTFNGFCGHHDNKIFEPIEDADYTPKNTEQEFLYAYRALSKEHYTKKTMTHLLENALKDINKGFSPLDNSVISNDHKFNLQMSFGKRILLEKNTIKKFELYQKRMNEWLQQSTFENIITDVIEFDEEYHFAVSATILIEKDIIGNTINNLDNFRDFSPAPLFLTIFPQNGKTYILMSYFERNKRRYKFIKDQIINKDSKLQQIIISNMVISYVENLAISPITWKRTSAKLKRTVENSFVNTLEDHGESLIFDNTINLFIK